VVVLPPEQQGDLLMARGDYAAALSAYRGGTLTSAVLWNKIGVAYHHLFALSEARKAYETALTIDPRYPPALNNLAAVYHGEHNYGQAERLYKRALKYQPNSAVTESNLGTSYFADGKYKNGMKAYKIAFRLDPNVFNPDDSKKVEEASSRRQLIAINYYLAKTYASAGRKEQALTYLRKAIGEGFSDRKRLMADKEFDPIRGTPEFHKFLVEEHLN
jgi:tetratricopeptide (TPR) repeat protein